MGKMKNLEIEIQDWEQGAMGSALSMRSDIISGMMRILMKCASYDPDDTKFEDTKLDDECRERATEITDQYWSEADVDASNIYNRIQDAIVCLSENYTPDGDVIHE